ncbi:MAG: flagellar hook-length control protein FliK [Gammaproteobacteria bacterium]|nr:flagellar hook-length control protein FliK [Gammaproteobacteria bacterium]
MMDISPLNRPQTDTAPPNATRRSESSSTTDDNHSFDRHLNERIDQARSAKESSNAEKSDVNQKSEAISEKSDSQGSDMEKESVVKQVRSESDTSSTQDEADTKLLIQTLLGDETQNASQLTTDDGLENQQILPQEGSDLPLLAEAEVTSKDELTLPEEGIAVPVIAVADHTEVKTSIKSADQVTEKMPAEKMPLAQPGPGIKSVSDAGVIQKENPVLNSADDVAINPEQISAKARQIIKSEEAKPVVTMDTKPSSVASVITTASLLQQVPGMTSLSSAQLATTTVTDPALSANSPLFKSFIPAAVQSSGWSQGVSERVAWMVQGNFQNAEIKLNPANLGPLEIKMSITEDQARISFVSAHAPVREALDQAIPRLREMLEQQGLNLADVDVSQYSDSKNEETGEFNHGAGQFMHEDVDENGSADRQQGVVQISSDSGVNLYA